jgi:hypothetical protein
MRLRVVLAVCLLSLALPACDGPTAGEISIDFITPNSSDGAISFRIESASSRELGELSADCEGCRAFSYRLSDSELFCVVAGALATGPLARITVSDVGVRSAYAVTILEVAGQDHRLRSTTGYELLLGR